MRQLAVFGPVDPGQKDVSIQRRINDRRAVRRKSLVLSLAELFSRSAEEWGNPYGVCDVARFLGFDKRVGTVWRNVPKHWGRRRDIDWNASNFATIYAHLLNRARRKLGEVHPAPVGPAEKLSVSVEGDLAVSGNRRRRQRPAEVPSSTGQTKSQQGGGQRPTP